MKNVNTSSLRIDTFYKNTYFNHNIIFQESILSYALMLKICYKEINQSLNRLTKALLKKFQRNLTWKFL